jgi:c(7)-type cytochrome triheme protein
MHANSRKQLMLPRVTLLLLTLLVLVGHASAEYGDIVMNSKAESMREAEVDDVLFPHWFHRIRYRCSVCHEKIFTLKAGSNDITMSDISIEHKMCGVCHDGSIAWEALECDRCHSIEPGWSAGPIQHAINSEEPDKPLIDTRKKRYTKLYVIASGWHPLALTDSGLPLDKYGLVDWANAVREGIVDPIWNLDPEANKISAKSLDSVIVFEAKGDFMPDVAFPHDIHSFWLQCDICHASKNGAIFTDKIGANNVNMIEIAQGKWCARCHDKVAFPISDCSRCHNLPKDEPLKKGMIRRRYMPQKIKIQPQNNLFDF